MSSFTNDPAEIVLHDWVKRARSSQREGARLLARFLRQAKREQGEVQKTAQEALVSAAGMLRREVDQLQRGLTGVSQRLATFEQEQRKKPARTPAKAPAKTPAKRVRRTTAAKRKLRRAA